MASESLWCNLRKYPFLWVTFSGFALKNYFTINFSCDESLHKTLDRREPSATPSINLWVIESDSRPEKNNPLGTLPAAHPNILYCPPAKNPSKVNLSFQLDLSSICFLISASTMSQSPTNLPKSINFSSKLRSGKTAPTPLSSHVSQLFRLKTI